MDKKILGQYENLLHERDEIIKRIQKVESDIRKYESYREDASKGKKHSSDVSESNYQDMISILKERRANLERIEKHIAETVSMVEEFIYSIPDEECIVRRIINLFVIDGKSWQEVAMAIGGGNTAESVRQIYCRYLKKH